MFPAFPKKGPMLPGMYGYRGTQDPFWEKWGTQDPGNIGPGEHRDDPDLNSKDRDMLEVNNSIIYCSNWLTINDVQRIIQAATSAPRSKREKGFKMYVSAYIDNYEGKLTSLIANVT